MRGAILSFFSFFFRIEKFLQVTFSARDDDEIHPALPNTKWIRIVSTIAHDGYHKSGMCPVIGAFTTKFMCI